jgi:hypothetical protein
MQDYFNYFTEIESFYQSKRKSFTLLTTLDWVLIENWKDQGIPLELVLKGIDRAFSRAKREINSLAYCMKAVSEVCDEQKELRVERPEVPEFSSDEVGGYLRQLAERVRAAGFFPIAERIEKMESGDLRLLEQQLSALEEKLVAHMTVETDEAALVELRRSVDSELNAYRSGMTPDQLAMLERQLWKRKLLEKFGVPRLSLFYLI